MELRDKMDLLCAERMTDINFAKIDPTIFHDDRVLKNMLDLEVKYIPRYDYFNKVQKDVQPFMRKVVTTWMLEVCEEQRCEDQVFPLAANFMDRFLCVCPVARQQLQLLGAATLLTASKIRQCHPLSVDLLCAYTDHSITPSELRNWELLLLSKLNWDMTAVTGFDYVDHVVERLAWGTDSPLIRRHSHTLVAICYTEPAFIQCPPSLIATACVCAAVRGLSLAASHQAMSDLCALTGSDAATAECIVAHIEGVVARETSVSPTTSSTQSTPQRISTSHNKMATTPLNSLEDLDDLQQPETPTDVQDVDF